MRYFALIPDDIREIHDEMIQRYGGVEGEHESGLIDYMADKPFMEVFGVDHYHGLFMKAAVYMHGFATAQYFVDGNKRTAYGCAATFLELNSRMMTVSDEDLYYMTKSVADNKVTVEELAIWIEENSMSY